MSEKLLDRVGALLAKAESTDSAAEAEALVAKAQEIATLHAVDLAVARARSQRSRRRQTPAQRKIVIGRPREQGRRHRIHLFLAVAGVNDVLVDIARDSTYVLAFGFPSDLEVVEALYASLATQMVATANAAIARGEHRHEEYWSQAAGTWRCDARVFRSAFNAGFVRAIGDRLRAAHDAALSQRRPARQTDDGAEALDGALVLARKADEVDAYYHSASRARGTWRGGGSRPVAWSQAGHSAGHAAGRAARLQPARPLPGARGALHQPDTQP